MVERMRLPAAWAAALAAQGQSEDLAWEPSRLAAWVEDRDAAQRLFAAALRVKLAEAQGHTRLVLEGPDAPTWLGAFGPPDAALGSDPALRGFVADEDGMAPLIVGCGWIATGRAVDQERRLAGSLRARATRRFPAELPSLPPDLNEAQQAAVRLAASAGLCVITGGPGTGKTAIVAALLGAVMSARPEAKVLLAAPTGKAAQRMGQALGGGFDAVESPQTLHRLLGWHPRNGWRHRADHPLRADLVIVDEASMVDQELMASLVDALEPEARLVLLGDADQLPSVGGGAVLRDLVSSLPGCVARLTRSYRMDASDSAGAAILRYAQKAREGALEDGDLGSCAAGITLQSADALPTFLGAWRERITALEGYAALIHHEHAPGPDGFDERSASLLATLRDHHARFRLLAMLQEGPRGAGTLNALLHAQAWALNGVGLQRDLPFYLGEPVMMTRNDYGRGLFNGDEGFIVKVRRGAEVHREVVFWKEGRLVAFPAASLQADLDLAYALTVHKAQGSEFDAIALLLPEGDHPLLTRQNLYTALTRARKHATILGDAALLPLAAKKVEPRATGLQALLTGTTDER